MTTIRASLRLAGICLAVAACGGGGDRESDTVDRSPDAGGQVGAPDSGGNPWADAAGGASTAVYAHSNRELFKVNPDDYSITFISQFQWPDSDSASFDSVGDIAIDQDGNMFGISTIRDRVYSIDPDTAKASLLSELVDNRLYNGLSFLPDPDGNGEILIGAATDGSVYKIDPATGDAELVGNYGDGLGSSGDLVYVQDFGIVATVTRAELGTSGTDWLASIDPLTYEATLIGDTGLRDIYGLGFWSDKVYGFSSNGINGTFSLIDVDSGVANPVGDATDAAWWGAGVTTKAPVEIE